MELDDEEDYGKLRALVFANGEPTKEVQQAKSDGSASDDIEGWQKLYKAKKIANKKYKDR